jgi:CheY-like chemotaxis protein/DNA-binding MarR family transcriptional regulator
MAAPGVYDRTVTSVDVLVVDDDLDSIEELVEFLAKAGLSCRSAGDGWAALKLLAEGLRAGIVVSDLRMPELDGVQFAERLSRFADGERPEIIFVSGNAGFDDAVAALRLGARDMLTKPVDGPRLVRAVKSAQLARQMRQQGAPAIAGAEVLSPVERRRATLRDFKAMRRSRRSLFPSELFSDPCWEMLLDLYDAQLAGAEVTVTSLGAASGVPLTTALRRMDELQQHNLIVRGDDAGDKRRTIIRLTESGLHAIDTFFDSLQARSSR